MPGASSPALTHTDRCTLSWAARVVSSSKASQPSIHTWARPDEVHAPAANARFFYIFLFSFFTKIYFRFGNLQEYTPVAPLPGGRDLAGMGISEKNFAEKIAHRSLGAGRPAAGRPALAARLQGDRLSHPYIRVGWSPTPHLHHYNSRNQEKRERGREAKPCRIFEPVTAGNQNSSTV